MKIDAKLIEQIILRRFDNALRFTQDSPVYPDVWLEYFSHATNIKNYRADLILTPHRKYTAGELFKQVDERLESRQRKTAKRPDYDIANNGEAVVVKLTLAELVNSILPLTLWHQKVRKEKGSAGVRWMNTLIGAILHAGSSGDEVKLQHGQEESLPAVQAFFEKRYLLLGEKFGFAEKRNKSHEPTFGNHDHTPLWSVNRNRPASISLERSVPATKADACRKVFDIDGKGIAWAVLDTGIDAAHPAFRRKDPATKKPYATHMVAASKYENSNRTRVVATYDFTKFREMVAGIHKDSKAVAKILKHTADADNKSLKDTQKKEYVQEIERDLRNGRVLDWTTLSPLLRIPHNVKEYQPPLHPHGTHVAGILGAAQYDKNGNCILTGMCPGIELYDIRVLGEKGTGDEFNILAALQFVRWINGQREGRIIHGVNLSFSMIHAVASYACGATPVCEACDRITSDGTVVVASAGNLGQAIYLGTDGASAQGFRTVNITDPGNAESVITVGATHRDKPHSYGVSYFSSKGPTGDGRAKPDLVAPGEKIMSSVLNDGIDRMDGTSMAAPHVSGAAALLMAKHSELVGKPQKIKQILCKTATDLGREKYFQGCGMLDVLRAIQSV